MVATVPPGKTSSRRSALRGVVGFLVVMELGSGMLQGWYPVLLEEIGTEFGVGAAELNWVSAAYMLATVVCVPILAKLGDQYGHKRLLAVSAATVALGSVVVAIAPTFGVFLLGRALQAPLAAFLPLEFAIVRDRDEQSAGRSIGKLVGALTLGAAIGALGSGLLFGAVGDLRVVLWLPAIFLTICVPVVIFLVPESSVRATGRTDWLGAALLGVGLLAALGGISNAATWGWDSPLTWLVIIGGAALLLAWIAVEKRVAYPLIDIAVLRHGGIGLPITIAFLFGAQLFGSQSASSVYVLTDPDTMGFGLGFTAATLGLIFLASALSAFVASSLGDRVSERIGARATIAVGGLLVTVSYLPFLFTPSLGAVIVGGMVVGGLGNGLLISVLPTIVVRRAPADSVGIASALYNTSRTAAGAVSGAVFALVMASFLVTVGTGTGAVTTTSFAGFAAVWIICAVIGLAIAALALLLRVPSARVIPSPTDAFASATPVSEGEIA